MPTVADLNGAEIATETGTFDQAPLPAVLIYNLASLLTGDLLINPNACMTSTVPTSQDHNEVQLLCHMRRDRIVPIHVYTTCSWTLLTIQLPSQQLARSGWSKAKLICELGGKHPIARLGGADLVGGRRVMLTVNVNKRENASTFANVVHKL